MALSNQYNNVDDKLVNQSIVKMLLHSSGGRETEAPDRKFGEGEREKRTKS